MSIYKETHQESQYSVRDMSYLKITSDKKGRTRQGTFR